MYKVYLKDEEATKSYGFKLGELAKKGNIICLLGDLGAGKTTLTQSFAKGLGVDDYVTSPTFTIVNEYDGRIPLYHFDVYRIGVFKYRIKICRRRKRNDTDSKWRRVY